MEKKGVDLYSLGCELIPVKMDVFWVVASSS
jgi:hypothetical protein